jgi:hypothetical protein
MESRSEQLLELDLLTEGVVFDILSHLFSVLSANILKWSIFNMVLCIKARFIKGTISIMIPLKRK